MLMKTAVVDDMQSEARLLEGFLKEYSDKTGRDMDITFFPGGESFLEAFEKEDFDLIFMDIYMNGISGVEVSKKLWESGRKYVLVFLTSSSEHMSDAFACHAFDYLLKPVTYERLERVMNDITRSDSTENIRLTNGREEFVLPCSSFVCAYSADHYIIIITSDGEEHRIRGSFASFSDAFEGVESFMVINRGTAVNMDCISDIEDGCCVMKDGRKLPIKVREYGNIRRKWHEYRFEKIRGERSRQ